MAFRQPDRCKCFGGFCMRGLCPEKPRREAAPPVDKPRIPTRLTSAWRADGSHENGPVPQGRIPQRSTGR